MKLRTKVKTKPSKISKDHLTTAELCEIIGGSAALWCRLRKLNFGPKFTVRGRVCMYRTKEVARWIKTPMGQRYFSGASLEWTS